MSIHPTAIVDAGAEVGTDVEIGPFSVVFDKTRIGDNTVIGPHVVVHSYTAIDPGCSIHANAVLGDLPQDLAFDHSESYVRIGSNCVIREGVTVHRGTKHHTSTLVGERCFLMAYSHVAHNVQIGNNVAVSNGALLAGYAEVGDGAFISGNCVVHQFVKIGKLAMLGGGCAVGKDVPPYCMTRPGSVNDVMGLNIVGMRRAGMNAAQRMEVQRAFSELYHSGLNISQAVASLKQRRNSGPALEFCDFVKASRRGICKASRGGGGDRGEG